MAPPPQPSPVRGEGVDDDDDDREEWRPRRSLLDRAAIYGVPVIAGLVTAAVLVGPGGERPVSGARARGVLVGGAQHYALRLKTLVHFSGAYAPESEQPLRLELSEGGRVLAEWRGTSDERGIAEARGELAAPLGSEVALKLWSGERLLAQGRAATVPQLQALGPEAPLEGAQRGTLRVGVRVPRGVTVAPFAEPIEVLVRTAPAKATPHLVLEAAGADVGEPGKPARAGCDDSGCNFVFAVRLTPRAPSVELRVEAASEGESGHWEGAVPVVTGAPWIDPDALEHGDLVLKTAVPKDEVYVSLFGRDGRLWGARVPMKSDERGFANGKLPRPALPDQPLTLVTSGDDEEPESTSASYPLVSAKGGVTLRPLALVLDGMPPALALERARRARARWPAFALLGAAAAFELFYLWRRNRIARADLAERMRAASGAAAAATMTARAPIASILLIASSLALAFATLAALIALWR